MHTQVIISLVSIAGAAAVALACDFLKARNAQLKDQMEKLAQLPVKRLPLKTEGPQRAARRSDRVISTQAVQSPGPIPIQRPAAPLPDVELKPKSDPTPSTWLLDRAMARAARKMGAESAPATPALNQAPLIEVAASPAAPASVVPASVVPASLVPDAVVVDTHLWDFLVSLDQATNQATNQAKQPQLEAPKSERVFEVIQGSGPATIDLQVPSGMQPLAALAQLKESRQPFTGLVISIGVSVKDPREARNEALGFSVEQFIAGLLRTSDFGCRVDALEFLLLCPGPRAAEAQRHLSHLSEQLWDYQLRSLGKSSLAFNMGGTDVQGENLPDAIASAQQRMNQSRRTTSLSLVPQRKRAV